MRHFLSFALRRSAAAVQRRLTYQAVLTLSSLTFVCLCPAAIAEEITVLAVGDITVGARLTPLIETEGARVFFEGTTPLIQSADIATASLNTSISERGEPRPGIKHPFRAAPGLGRALANAGFDAVSLATPHLMDFGLEALQDTLAELKGFNVKPIGAGLTAAAARRPAWVSIKGTEKQVALFAYYRQTDFARYTADPVAYAVYSDMVNAVAQARQNAERIIVWLHWGTASPDATQRESALGRQQLFAHALIDAGADMVLCQQLHTLGGIELYQGKPIVYSLADFIYDVYDKQHTHLVIPKATWTDGVLASIELIPIVTETPHATYQPQPLHGEVAIETLRAYQQRCAQFNTEVSLEGERGWIRP